MRGKVSLGMCAQRRLKSACTFAQSDKSLRCPHAENLSPWQSKLRPGKTRLAPVSSDKIIFLIISLIIHENKIMTIEAGHYHTKIKPKKKKKKKKIS